VEVIVENTELEPLLPITAVCPGVEAPPAPIVTVYEVPAVRESADSKVPPPPVAVTVDLRPPAPPPPVPLSKELVFPPPLPPPATTK
jgi:hypothetical protein